MESDLNEKYLSEEFGQNLGKLFYAVAKADKEVRQLEIRQLREDILLSGIPSPEWMICPIRPSIFKQISKVCSKRMQKVTNVLRNLKIITIKIQHHSMQKLRKL